VRYVSVPAAEARWSSSKETRGRSVHGAPSREAESMNKRDKRKMKKLEGRVDQLEQDVIDLTYTNRELLIWKRQQSMRVLPKAHGEYVNRQLDEETHDE